MSTNAPHCKAISHRSEVGLSVSPASSEGLCMGHAQHHHTCEASNACTEAASSGGRQRAWQMKVKNKVRARLRTAISARTAARAASSRTTIISRHGLSEMRESVSCLMFLSSAYRMLIAHKKLSKLAAPDPFKSSSSSIKDGSRKVGENKLLGKAGTAGGSKSRYSVRRTAVECLLDLTGNHALHAHTLPDQPLHIQRSFCTPIPHNSPMGIMEPNARTVNSL